MEGCYALNEIKPVGQYESFPNFLNRLKPGEGKRFAANKVAFAGRICPLLTSESIATALDLGDRLSDLLGTKVQVDIKKNLKSRLSQYILQEVEML